MEKGASMQVNLCPKSNNGQVSCSVLTESDKVSESQAVVKLDQTIATVFPLEGQVALITKPSSTPAQSPFNDKPTVLKRRCPESKDQEDDSQKSRKTKLWLQENMFKAIDAVHNGMHIRTASKLFSVPRTTLKYKLDSTDQEKSKDIQITFATSEVQSSMKSDEIVSFNKKVLIESDIEHCEQTLIELNGETSRIGKVVHATESSIFKKPTELSFNYLHILPAPQTETTTAHDADRLNSDKSKHHKKSTRQNQETKKKCKLWSEETMNEAVEAVCKGSKIKDAAVLYGVPMSTLGNRVLARRRKTAEDNSTTMTTITAKPQADVVTSVYTPILPAPSKHLATSPMDINVYTCSTSQALYTIPTVVIANEAVTMTTTTSKPMANPGKLRGKIKQWSEESMEKALRALKEEGLSVYAAARKYNVPKSTLDAKKKRLEYHIKGSSKADIIINPEDEYPLVSYVNICARFGITNIKNVVLLLAAEKAESRGRWNVKEQGLLPDVWWERFLDRCARLIKNVDITQHPFRVTEARLGLFFDKLLAVVNSSQYHKTPLTNLNQRTYTVQEFGFKGNGSSGWVYDESFTTDLVSSNNTTDYSNDSCYSSASSSIDDSSDGNSNYTNSCPSNRVSAMCCVNASGTSLPPLFVVHTSQSDYKVNQAGPDHVIVHDVNDKSRDSDYYYTWLNEVLIKHAYQERPVILLIDPDTSFVTPEFIALANKHQIILLCLPPLSARMTQPLCTAVLPALQQGFKDVSCKKRAKNDSSQFLSAFKEAWRSRVNSEIIKSGFRKSGIYPLNRKVFDHLDLPRV